MRTLVATKNMEKTEWLKWRTMGIGGSDASVIAGVNPYRSVFQLWKEKTGQVEPEEKDSEFTHFGSLLEPVIKREFTRRTGLKVRNRYAILQSEEYPFMLADLDGIIYEDHKLCIFEAKTASAYKKEVWEQGVPREYLYQIQHYMAVTGAEKTYIAALVGGNHFLYHEVRRDEAMIRDIIQLEKDFWENHVLTGKEPQADGSKATADYLEDTYGTSNGKVVELPEESLALFEQYDSISQQLAQLKEEKEAVTNQMKHYLKENEKGVIGDRQVTWKSVTSTGFDRKRLEQEQNEVYEKYCTKIQYRKLSVA